MTALFNHAEKFYDLKDNPCKKVDKMGRPNAKELNFWTKDEYEPVSYTHLIMRKSGRGSRRNCFTK